MRYALVALALLSSSVCDKVPPIPPTPTPTPAPTTTTTTLPAGPPIPACSGQACDTGLGCAHKPGEVWLAACCAPWVTGGVVNVSAGEPCPTPPPPPPTTLPPVAPPSTGVAWKETEQGGPDLCGVATSRHLEAVRAAQIAVPLIPGEDEGAYYTRLCNAALRPKGLDCAFYGEELAVAETAALSENYDLILASGGTRAAFYASTCTPATRSAPIPASIPAPPPDPPAGGGAATWPKRVDQVRAKVHVPASQRGDGRAVIDAVALTCDAACAPRTCCPACGPEGSPGREECDRSLPVLWEGGQEHPSNPWLRFLPAGQRARVCVGAACSEWVRE